jgi:hypothetical protein
MSPRVPADPQPIHIKPLEDASVLMLVAKPALRRRHATARPLFVAVLLAMMAGTGLASALAAQAAAGPDAHDRTLVAALAARVATFRDIDTSAFGASVTHAFHTCVPLEKSIIKSKGNFGAAFSSVLTAAFDLALPLTINLADRYKPQLTALRSELTGMHADSPLFAQWLSTEAQSLSLILEFDSNGQPVNACTAAAYMQGIAKTSKTRMAAVLAEFPREVGISLDQYKALGPRFYSNSNPTVTLASLAPRTKAFFVAAGLTQTDAALLSSSE